MGILLYPGMPKIPWTQQDIKLFKEIYPYLSNKEIQRQYFPLRTIYSLESLGKNLKVKKQINSQRVGSIEPLLQDTPEAFYWIGFIFADGSVINRTRLSINLSEKDHEHLNKLALFLNTTTNVCVKNGYCNNGLFCNLRIQDKQRVPELCSKFDLKSRKTYNPPSLCIDDDDLFISFLCGFIDGDGCILLNKYRKNCINIRIKIHGSWLDTLRYIEQRTYSALHIAQHTETVRTNLNKKGFAVLTFSDNTLIRQIKQRAIDLKLPIMNRKWDKINTNLVSKYIITQKRKDKITQMLNAGMYPAQISRELGLNLSTTYGLVNRINAKHLPNQ